MALLPSARPVGSSRAPARSGTPRVTGLRTASAAEWDAVADRSPHATFFHTREWGEIWQEYTGGALTPTARIATFDDGRSALLPSVDKTLLDLPRVGRLSPALRTVISSYGSTYGGWVGADGLTAAHHRALWERTRRFNVSLSQNPYDAAMAEAGLPWTRADFTQIVDLGGDYDTLRRGWSRGHVSAVNKALRGGLSVVQADTERQWTDYVRVYGLSLQRWQNPLVVHRAELFRTLAASRSGKVRLWVVEHEGAVIAGAVCLYQGSTVVYWHGAFDAAFQHLRAAPLLHAEIMRGAMGEGYRWYDFNPSGGNQGVITFKDRFGAERRDANSLIDDAGLKRRLHAVRDAARRVAHR